MESNSNGQHQNSPPKASFNQSNLFKLSKQVSIKNPQTDTQNIHSPMNIKKVYSMTSFNENLFASVSSSQSIIESSTQSDFPKSSTNLLSKKSSFSNDFLNPSNSVRDRAYVSTSPFLTENEITKQESIGFDLF